MAFELVGGGRIGLHIHSMVGHRVHLVVDINFVVAEEMKMKILDEARYNQYADQMYGDLPRLLITEVIRIGWERFRYWVGGLVCRRYGHSKHVQVEEFVSCDRDDNGRITDIDGGGVDWFCPRCGNGGHSWF